MDFKKIGMRLNELRKEKKFSLEKLSEKTGIDISMLSRYENGKNYKNGMHIYNMVQIATELETSLDYIVFGKGPKIVSYEKSSGNDFGSNFVKSISFLTKNFSTNMYKDENSRYEYDPNNDKFILEIVLHQYDYFDFATSTAKIRNLYINGDEDNSKHFKSYENETLKKFATELNKAKKKHEKDIEESNKNLNSLYKIK